VAHRKQLLAAVGGQKGRQVSVGVDLVAEGLLAPVELPARQTRNLPLDNYCDYTGKNVIFK